MRLPTLRDVLAEATKSDLVQAPHDGSGDLDLNDATQLVNLAAVDALKMQEVPKRTTGGIDCHLADDRPTLRARLQSDQSFEFKDPERFADCRLSTTVLIYQSPLVWQKIPRLKLLKNYPPLKVLRDEVGEFLSSCWARRSHVLSVDLFV